MTGTAARRRSADRKAKRIAAAERETKRIDAAAAAAAAKAAAHEKERAFDAAVQDARDHEVPGVAADLVASQPARLPWDDVEGELLTRHATEHRYDERREIDGATVRVGTVRMDLEGAIIDHATSHRRGASRVPPARPATLGAAITTAVDAIQAAVDQLVHRILDQVLGVRDPAPAAATQTAPAHGAAPTDERPSAHGGEKARGSSKTDRLSRETTRDDGGHGHDASAPELLPSGVRIDAKADEAPDLDRGHSEPRPGGAGDRRSTPKQDLNPD